MNCDVYSDVIIGANGFSSYTGRAYVFFGGANMNTIVDIKITGESTNSGFGVSVSNTGDVNGDGYSEVIVGADRFSSYTGRAYVYDYYMKGDITYDFNIDGEATGNRFGNSVSEAGDVNGDGFDDFIVGAYGFNSNSGRAYIYFGGQYIDNIADVVMTGDSANHFFGRSVSSAGDVNNDGYSDVIIGASGNSAVLNKAFIFYGGISMNNVADLILTNNILNTNFEIQSPVPEM
ncbi:MAG: FG-GAP repeat protein [Ignavibacteria bacterium]|nr:FG-GAP repeat protein [Ignavibacteria bacterium]